MNIVGKYEPLDLKGLVLAVVMVMELIILWVIGLYGYITADDTIPTHFSIHGIPTTYGSKTTLLIIPAAFSIAPTILLTITKLRFTLINKYPYLINLPAFYTNITKLPPEERGKWINKYFNAILTLGVLLTAWLTIIEIGIIQATINQQTPQWLLPTTLAAPILFIALFIIQLHKIQNQLNKQ